MPAHQFKFRFILFFVFMFSVWFSASNVYGRVSCQNVCSKKSPGVCYTPLFANNDSGCQCGNQYCKADSCAARGIKPNPNSTTKEDRCLDKESNQPFIDVDDRDKGPVEPPSSNDSSPPASDAALSDELRKCLADGGKIDKDDEHVGKNQLICVCNDNSGRRFGPWCSTRDNSRAATSSSMCSELEQFIKDADACQKDGIDAVKQCNKDAKETNASYDQAQSVLGLMSQVAQAKAQQAGVAENCFRTGALGAASWYALNQLKDTCESEMDDCKSKCSKATTEFGTVYEKCMQKYIATNSMATEDNKMDYANKLKEKLDASQKILNTGIDKCTVEAKKNEQDIATLMNQMNKASAQSAQCTAKVTPGQGVCSQLMGPADCAKLATADPVCCPQIITANCTGADKDTKMCVCLRDPNAAMCMNLGTNPSVKPSQVAGMPSGTSNNLANMGSPNYKTSPSGGMNLGDLVADEGAASAASADRSGGGDPFGVAAAANGGGGGGGAGGGGPSDAPAGEPDADRKSGSLFNQIKSGFMNALGLTPKKDVAGKAYGDKKKDGTGIDPNKWRPTGLRGLAGESVFGGRNEDIFKKINSHYNLIGHTFDSNMK